MIECDPFSILHYFYLARNTPFLLRSFPAGPADNTGLEVHGE